MFNRKRFEIGDWVEFTTNNGDIHVGWIKDDAHKIYNKKMLLVQFVGDDNFMLFNIDGRYHYKKEWVLRKCTTFIETEYIDYLIENGYPPPSKWKKSDLI